MHPASAPVKTSGDDCGYESHMKVADQRRCSVSAGQGVAFAPRAPALGTAHQSLHRVATSEGEANSDPKPRLSSSEPHFDCNITSKDQQVTTRFVPDECPKCGTELTRSPKGGRPTRWCSEGCKRSGEAEMARLQSILKTYESGRTWDKLNGYATGTRDAVIAELQDRFDHLAGVPIQIVERDPGVNRG